MGWKKRQIRLTAAPQRNVNNQQTYTSSVMGFSEFLVPHHAHPLHACTHKQVHKQYTIWLLPGEMKRQKEMQMEKQKRLAQGAIIILSPHLWRAERLISILKLSAAILCSPFVLPKVAGDNKYQGNEHQPIKHNIFLDWWHNLQDFFCSSAQSYMQTNVLLQTLFTHSSRTSSIKCVFIVYARCCVWIKKCIVRWRVSYSTITGGSFNSALGLQRDIGAKRD